MIWFRLYILEKNFAKLILENLDHTHDSDEYDYLTENLSENQTRYTAINISDEFFTWLMLEDRKYGDWTMVQDGYSTTFYFYYGEGQSYRDICVENALLNEWYESITGDAIDSCNYDPDIAKEYCKLSFY